MWFQFSLQAQRQFIDAQYKAWHATVVGVDTLTHVVIITAGAGSQWATKPATMVTGLSGCTGMAAILSIVIVCGRLIPEVCARHRL